MQAPNVGARIKEARLDAGLSQTELATRLGRHWRTIQAWEGNTRTPRMKTLLQLAGALERDPGWFYTEPEDIAA